MSTQINTGLITPVLPLVVVKIEPPESEIVEIGIDDILSASDEEIIPDVKVIDSVLHMKEAQFVKRANITLSDNLIKAEVTTDGNINKGTGQGSIEVQGNLNIHEQLVLNFLDDLDGNIIKSRKPKHHKNTDGNILWTSRKEDNENIKFIEAPVIPYYCEQCTFISRTYAEFKLHEQSHKIKAEMDDRVLKYRCNKCTYKTFRQNNYKKHKLIHLKPEETQYFYCYHCSYKFNRKDSLQRHILRHYKKGEIQFHCYICNFMTPERELIIEHIKTLHSKVQFKTHTENQENRYCCEKCTFISGAYAEFKLHEESHKGKAEIDDRVLKCRCRFCKYKTFRQNNYKAHKLIYLQPEETQYFYCYHCSYKFNRKDSLQRHILRHYKNGEIQFHCYFCNFMTQKRELIIEHIKTPHSKVQFETRTKNQEERYCCEKCTFISATYAEFKQHEQSHKIKAERDDRYLKYRCNKCKYKTFRRNNFYAHKKIHLKPEEIQYFHCYHCTHKSRRKDHLRDHIFNHFKNEEVTFHCYICDFMTRKNELIIKHIKKHSKV